MGTILFLIGFPIIIALILLVSKEDKVRDVVVKLAAIVIAAASIVVAVQYFKSGGTSFEFHAEFVNYIMMAIEALLAIYIIIIGIRHKKYLASLFAIIQTPLLIWFELTKVHGMEVRSNMYVDRLSIIMILIIGIIGSLITVYALGYMKDFQHHHADEPDRRPWFFFVMFIFLGAMVGLVTSNNMIWMYFFWEITSLSSFWLIGYTKTKEATNNAFRALIMNLLGGLSFAVGIVVLGTVFGTIELDAMLMYGSVYGEIVAIPAAFLRVCRHNEGGTDAVQQLAAGRYGSTYTDVGSAPLVNDGKGRCIHDNKTVTCPRHRKLCRYHDDDGRRNNVPDGFVRGHIPE